MSTALRLERSSPFCQSCVWETRGRIFFSFATSVADITQAGAWDSAEKSLRNGADLLRTIPCTLNLDAMRQTQNSAEDSLRSFPARSCNRPIPS